MSTAPADHAAPEAGFSVVETLVALFVFALAGVGLLSMQTQSVETYARVETRALASIIAENRLVDAMAVRTAPAIGMQYGQTELGGRIWRWRVDVLPTEDPATVRIEASAFAPGQEAPAARISAFRMAEAAS